MKLCKDDKCRCKTAHWCVLCKHYDFNKDAAIDDDNLNICMKKNVKVGGHSTCPLFECFRVEEE